MPGAEALPLGISTTKGAVLYAVLVKGVSRIILTWEVPFLSTLLLTLVLTSLTAATTFVLAVVLRLDGFPILLFSWMNFVNL